MIGLLWGVPFLLLVYFCGSRVARFVYRKTGSRHWAIVSLFLGCTIPWADAWIGVPYFYYWQRSHPAGAVYETAIVEGYLRADGGGASGTSGIPKPSARYGYVEMPRDQLGVHPISIEGDYVSVSVVPAPDEDCIESTRPVVSFLRRADWPMDNDEYCLKVVGQDEPVSRYALVMEDFSERPDIRTIFQQGPWRRVNEGFFRIYGRQQKIVDRKTEQVIAEAWDASYVPWLATWTGLPVFSQSARSLAPLPTLHPIAILIPQGPGAGTRPEGP
jgi:hypothetical protein